MSRCVTFTKGTYQKPSNTTGQPFFESRYLFCLVMWYMSRYNFLKVCNGKK